jgi:hypothetical protein
VADALVVAAAGGGHAGEDSSRRSRNQGSGLDGPIAVRLHSHGRRRTAAHMVLTLVYIGQPPHRHRRRRGANAHKQATYYIVDSNLDDIHSNLGSRARNHFGSRPCRRHGPGITAGPATPKAMNFK